MPRLARWLLFLPIIVLLSILYYIHVFDLDQEPAEVGPGALERDYRWAHDMSIVYTWVNGSDPEHLKLKAHYSGGDVADSRDRSNDELRYSLRSLYKYLPWHRGDIFIVTPNQTPTWLNTTYPRVKIIDQATLLPSRANPSFNSFVVEAYLDQIPGLTNHFLQMNDDYFFKLNAHPAYFFTAHRAPIFYWEGWTLPFTESQLKMDAYSRKAQGKTKNTIQHDFDKAVKHTAERLGAYFGVNGRRMKALRHAPYAWRKDFFKKMRSDFEEELDVMLSHRFRDAKDCLTPYINQATYIHAQPPLLREDSPKVTHQVASKLKSDLFMFAAVVDNTEKNEKIFKVLRGETPASRNWIHFNLNDEYQTDEAGQQMVEFLKWMYPEPAPWEL